MKPSPTLSVRTSRSSLRARWTILRSYGFMGSSSKGSLDALTRSAVRRAISPISLSRPSLKPALSTRKRVSAPKRRCSTFPSRNWRDSRSSARRWRSRPSSGPLNSTTIASSSDRTAGVTSSCVASMNSFANFLISSRRSSRGILPSRLRRGRRVRLPVDQVLLGQSDHVAHQPVDDEPAGHSGHHEGKEDWHHPHHPALHGIGDRIRGHVLLDHPGDPHQNRGDVVGIHPGEVANPEEERRAAELNRYGKQVVERDEDRHLKQQRKASTEAAHRVQPLLLVNRHDLVV